VSEDLLEFITARLDDDEQIARACGEGVTWAVEHRSDWETGDPAKPDPECAAGRCECCIVEGANPDGTAGMRIYDEGGHDSHDAEHMARHDPARVLREVAAKRRILAAAAGYSPELEHGDNGEWAFEVVLRLLALPFADHPGYDPSWSPTDD
jgi:hypothetical protein